MRELVFESSVLERIAYSAEQRSLLVQFKKDQRAVWEYTGVAQSAFNELEASSSKGRAFAAAIRGKHPEAKLGEGDDAFDARVNALSPEKRLAGFYMRLEAARGNSAGRAVIRF